MNTAPPALLAPGSALTLLVGPYRLWVDALWVREVILPKMAPVSGRDCGPASSWTQSFGTIPGERGCAHPASEGQLDEAPPRLDGLTGGGHLSWRNRLVPVIDLGALLGHSRDPSDPLPGIDVIYGENEAETLVSLRVNRVIGIRHWTPIEVRPLPPLPPDPKRLFAGIILDPAGGPGLLWFHARPGLLLRLWRNRLRTGGDNGA